MGAEQRMEVPWKIIDLKKVRCEPRGIIDDDESDGEDVLVLASFPQLTVRELEGWNVGALSGWVADVVEKVTEGESFYLCELWLSPLYIVAMDFSKSCSS